MELDGMDMEGIKWTQAEIARLRAALDAAERRAQEATLATLAAQGQAAEAHEARLKAEAERDAARAKALEDAANVAFCHSDDRPRRYSMDWSDGYIDGCRGAASAIRAMIEQEDRG